VVPASLSWWATARRRVGEGLLALSSEDDVRVRRGSEAGLQTPVNNFGLVEATMVPWAGQVAYVCRRVGAGGSLWTGQVNLACNFIFLKIWDVYI